jgi:hypothetical protein
MSNEKTLAAEEIARLRETLTMIADADWRDWGELASPDEFVIWAKARASYVLTHIGEGNRMTHNQIYTTLTLEEQI